MESFAAGASGAALGYIVKNLPGAYWGYKLGKMAPIYRKRRYSASSGGMRKKQRTGSYRMRQPRKRFGSNNIVTVQHDYTNQYRKTTMPKRKKKQWKKFINKVTAVNIKNAGLKTVLFNDRVVNSSGIGYQSYLAFCLYGVNGGNSANQTEGYDDLLKVFNNEPLIKRSSPGNEAINGVLNFASAVIDLTLRNLGEQDAEVDVYYGIHWKDATNENPRTGVTTANLIQDLNDGGYSQPISTGNTTVSLADRGATPFDISTGISASGFKVLRKQKLLMPPGKSVFIQHRDPRNHRLDWIDTNKAGYAKKKLTYEILIIHKPAVSSADNIISTIAAGVTRKYSYTVLEWNQDESALL